MKGSRATAGRPRRKAGAHVDEVLVLNPTLFKDFSSLIPGLPAGHYFCEHQGESEEIEKVLSLDTVICCEGRFILSGPSGHRKSFTEHPL